MKLLFLGTGSGLSADLENYQSNMILFTNNGKKLLIDCGTDIRFSLARSNQSVADIDAVYASHLHADHVGGLEWFALQRKFVHTHNKPELIAHKLLIPLLWENSLSGGLKTLEEHEAQLDDFFVIKPVADQELLKWDDIELELVKTIHVHSDHQLMPSYGICIKYHNKFFFISSDTQFAPELFAAYYQKATLIFHDCETLKTPSSVHANYEELKTLAPEIKAKMWLYHYNDGVLPDAHADGFKGFISCGQTIELK